MASKNKLQLKLFHQIGKFVDYVDLETTTGFHYLTVPVGANNANIQTGKTNCTFWIVSNAF